MDRVSLGERWRAAASVCLFTVLASIAGVAQAALVIDARQAAVRTVGAVMPDGCWNLWSDGQLAQPVRVAQAGAYRLVVRAYGSPAGGVWPEMAFLVDGRQVQVTSVNQTTLADYTITADLPAGTYAVGVAFLNDAVIGTEDRNLYLDRITITPPPGVPDPVVASLREAAQSERDRERAVLAAADADIERLRKVDVVLRVVDSTGQPAAGATVRAEQTRHEFLFGCNLFRFGTFGNPAQEAEYRRRFAALFNYATTGFYWIEYERRRGQPNYAYTNQVVAWCAQQGIRIKGHPLLWGDDAGIPPWSHGQPAADVQRRRVDDILARYRGKIGFWEVVNEPAHQPLPRIDEPYRWARQADPQGVLIVNDYHVLADGCPAFFRLLKQAQADGVPFDGIGIQSHEPRGMRFPLHQVQRTLDQYATLGKGLHMTEFTPSSGGQPIIGSDGVWDESAQADYAVKFYRVCFAHPAVRAITWWDLCDDGAWVPGGGMLRADLSPKPVYRQLLRLIQDNWRTRTSGTTDAAGRFIFRGFAGEYQIGAECATGKARMQAAIGAGQPREIVLRLP